MEGSTVRVISELKDGTFGSGSGFVVGDGAMVVTNWHVVADASRLLVVLGERDEIGAAIAQKDELKDMAILRLDRNSNRPSVTMVKGDQIRKGQTVYALGFPIAADTGQVSSLFEANVTRGIISKMASLHSGARGITTDAAINPGNSGGPLFDECGRVIGINAEKALAAVVTVDQDGNTDLTRVPEGEGIGRAIAVDEVIPLLEREGIRVAMQASPCLPSSEAAPRDPLMFGFAIAGSMMALVSLVLASTKRGRQRVKEMATHTIGLRRKHATPPRSNSTTHRLFLSCLKGTFAGSEFDLDERGLVVGRDPSQCQLVIPDADGVVSKRHCEVSFDAAARCFRVEDCHSKNGTFLTSGEQIPPGESRPLRSGEGFYVGDHVIELELREEGRPANG